MWDSLKTKTLIILLAATLIVPAFILAYQPKDVMRGPERQEELWMMTQSPLLPSEKVEPFSKEFIAGFRDASMAKEGGGPIKVEGG
ncbi:MAG: hypothetical protein FJ106_08335 [Deltaproteobacteria bacterium]|nr:hypothetical protein [Deltaproteobacteria bacterium]